MEIWSKCDICGRDIPVGELCCGLKNGNCICKDCCTGFENCTFTLAPAPTLAPPNELLTLEQLREMEGQWIIIKAFDADISGIMPAFIKDQFATTLCELGSKAIVPDLCEVHFSFNEYGKTWIAYRRPKEEQ